MAYEKEESAFAVFAKNQAHASEERFAGGIASRLMLFTISVTIQVLLKRLVQGAVIFNV